MKNFIIIISIFAFTFNMNAQSNRISNELNFVPIFNIEDPHQIGVIYVNSDEEFFVLNVVPNFKNKPTVRTWTYVAIAIIGLYLINYAFSATPIKTVEVAQKEDTKQESQVAGEKTEKVED